MLISIVCPHCKTDYQLHGDLRGKAMRCKQAACQKVFMIAPAPATAPAAAPAPAPASAQRQQTGSVGDVVPLLPAESNGPPAQEPVGLSWLEAPPPRRAEPAAPTRPTEQPPARPTATRTARAPASTGAAPATEKTKDWTAPPPVRRTTPETDTKFPAAPATVKIDHPVLPDADEAHKPRGWAAKWIIYALVGLTVATLGTGGVLLFVFLGTTEASLAKEADKAYALGTFGNAARTYRDLAKIYKDSESAPRYAFRAELASLRDRAKDPAEVAKLLEDVTGFIEARKDDPLLGEHAGDLGQSLKDLAESFAKRAVEEPTEDMLEVFDRIRATAAQARAIKRAPTDPEFNWGPVEEAMDKARLAVAAKKYERDLLASLGQTAEKGTYQALLDIEANLAREGEKFPGLAGRPEVKQTLLKFYRAHVARTVYAPHKEGDEPELPRVREENEPALWLDPLLGGTPAKDRPDTPVALALARGVLYGLDRESGRARWAMRVGIDTAALPVRVKADGKRESILALSSDTRTLTALDSDGNQLWRYRMAHPILGQPVVIDNRAYLSARNGDVHEIELFGGKRLGTYSLGQPLTLGGTREPNSSRVYFPAEAGCVYVIDVKTRKCEAILYSRHPAGSLRGEAALVGPDGDDVPGYLILTQASGLDSVDLRVFKLPITNKLDGEAELAPQVPLTPPARLDGWTWFRPYSDPEKLVLLSDAGVLGMFGVRQARNKDQALFPMIGGGLRLDAVMSGEGKGERGPRGRAEVVQMEGDDLWLLAANKLHRMRLAWDPDAGPKLVRVWDRPQEVGSPLHAGQQFEDGVGKTALVVVTQPPRQPANWASCFDDETGRLRWRRQLGVVCQGEPVPLALPGKAPVLLLIDQSGALFAADPQKYAVADDSPGVFDHTQARLAEPLDENPDQPPVVLPAGDGSVYVVASPGEGKELVIRHVTPQKDRTLKVAESRVKTPHPLWGTPALVGSRLVLPMANGKVARVKLGESPELQTGFDWRLDRRAGPETRGHVLALGGDRFLTTAGIRSLYVWDWPDGAWAPLPKGRGNAPTFAAPDRLVAPPLRLPDGGVVLADSAGAVTLLEQQKDGGLTAKATWQAVGQVTAGPFVETVGGEPMVFCVCRSRLVCIDPKSPGKPKWEHASEGGVAIVGRPRLAAGMVVIADEGGGYVGLDPSTGVSGPTYRLTGSIAPVASPVDLDGKRLFAPLSDGTQLLLSVERIRGRK